MKESLASIDTVKGFGKTDQSKNKHVETIDDHKKQLVSEMNVLTKNMKRNKNF